VLLQTPTACYQESKASNVLMDILRLNLTQLHWQPIGALLIE